MWAGQPTAPASCRSVPTSQAPVFLSAATACCQPGERTRAHAASKEAPQQQRTGEAGMQMAGHDGGQVAFTLPEDGASNTAAIAGVARSGDMVTGITRGTKEAVCYVDGATSGLACAPVAAAGVCDGANTLSASCSAKVELAAWEAAHRAGTVTLEQLGWGVRSEAPGVMEESTAATETAATPASEWRASPQHSLFGSIKVRPLSARPASRVQAPENCIDNAALPCCLQLAALGPCGHEQQCVPVSRGQPASTRMFRCTLDNAMSSAPRSGGVGYTAGRQPQQLSARAASMYHGRCHRPSSPGPAQQRRDRWLLPATSDVPRMIMGVCPRLAESNAHQVARPLMRAGASRNAATHDARYKEAACRRLMPARDGRSQWSGGVPVCLEGYRAGRALCDGVPGPLSRRARPQSAGQLCRHSVGSSGKALQQEAGAGVLGRECREQLRVFWKDGACGGGSAARMGHGGCAREQTRCRRQLHGSSCGRAIACPAQSKWAGYNLLSTPS
jgi:hypothetical protein